MRGWCVVMAVAIELALRGTSLAADPRFPDWPCNQIKVPEISVAAVWAGPPIDDVGNAWEEDATIRDLVARLAARRTPLDDAQKAIADVITGSESERQKKAKLLFAGLFKTLNDERSDVMRESSGMLANKGNFPTKSAPRFSSCASFRTGLMPTRAESTN